MTALGARRPRRRPSTPVFALALALLLLSAYALFAVIGAEVLGVVAARFGQVAG
jgi:hypothetical protein